MEHVSLRRILLPTIITSSVVFYAATSAFTSVTLRSSDGRTLQNGRLQYSLSQEYKEWAVRSVGLCILVSVGAGLTVAEVLRRRKRMPDPNQFEQGFFSKAELFAPTFPLNPVALSSNGASAPIRLASEIENPASPLTHTHATDQALTLEFSYPQQICRIKVPYSYQSLFAISLDGQYYNFSRSEKDPAIALKVLAHHTHQEKRAVVTQTGDRYVIWTWQPQAELVVQD